MKTFRELREMTQRFAFDNLKKATKAEKSAPKFNLRVDSGVEGKIYYVAVTGKYTDIIKWMKTLDEGTVKETKNSLEEARIPNYKPTKYEGKKFDRKKEIKSLQNMQKAIHKVAKMQDNMQYTAETGGSRQRGNPHAIYQSLVNAEQAIFDYIGGIERGYFDGIIDMDRD